MGDRAFLNKKNAADVRVYQLLDEKSRLFDGVFGASDEVLGAVESGVDFEKRIAGIYQKCRTTEQIQFEFDQLQLDLEAQISSGQRDAREMLLDNFDQEVVEKVRIESHAMLDRFNDQLRRLTRHVLAGHASFSDGGFSYMLHANPFPGETINRGPHRMAKGVEDANTYRVGHPLAQRVLARAQAFKPEPADVVLDYAGSGKNIVIFEPLRGCSGRRACRASVSGKDRYVSIDDGSLLLDSGRLAAMKELVEAGHIGPVVDRCYPFEDIAEAHRYVGKGHKRGGVAVTVRREVVA